MAAGVTTIADIDIESYLAGCYGYGNEYPYTSNITTTATAAING